MRPDKVIRPVAVVVLTLTATAWAAPGSPSRRQAPKIRASAQNLQVLLETEIVRSELKITPQQQEKLSVLWWVCGTEGFDVAADRRIVAAVETILLPAQSVRLEEIVFQAFMPCVFDPRDPDIAALFGYSDTSKKTIVGILEEKVRKDQDAVTRLGLGVPAGADPQDPRWRVLLEEQRCIAKEALRRIYCVLSPEQRRLVEKMKGRCIDLRVLESQLQWPFPLVGGEQRASCDAEMPRRKVKRNWPTGP